MPEIPFERLRTGLRNVHKTLADCQRAYDQHRGESDWEKDNRFGIYACPEAAAKSLMERAFLQCIALCQFVGLDTLLRLAEQDYLKARDGKLLEDVRWEEGADLVWAERIRGYLDGIEGGLGLSEEGAGDAALAQIIRNAQYLLGDPQLFGAPPRNEGEVHVRLEAFLKAAYADTVHKPPLGKAVKSFEADTGVPSLHTLIEYKFVSKREDVGVKADEILADTRGYASVDWRHLLFVIYETERFCSEGDWRKLLKDCQVPGSVNVIVLCGGSPPPGKLHKPKGPQSPRGRRSAPV